MKEKIFKALRDAILIGGKTSVSDATINMYVGLIDVEKITDESQIAEAIKPFVSVLQATQANINSVAASSVSAKESELKTAHQKEIEDLKKATPDTTMQDPPKDVPEWQKAIEGLTATVQNLATSVGAQQAEKTHEMLTQKLNTLLTEKKVPTWYSSDILDGRTFKDETEVNVWAEKIGTKWGERNQELANNGFKETVPPSQGSDNVKEIDTIVATITNGTKQIVEQNKQ